MSAKLSCPDSPLLVQLSNNWPSVHLVPITVQKGGTGRLTTFQLFSFPSMSAPMGHRPGAHSGELEN